MKHVNVQDAKTHLSRLLAEVERGEQIVIDRAGQPVAKLVPAGALAPRVLGMDEGRIQIAEDFDAPLPDEILSAFEGS